MTETKNNESKKPSKSRLKRVSRCQIDLGHYIAGSPCRRLGFWHAVVRGAPDRLVVAVQERRSKRYRTLYKAALDLTKTPEGTCDMDLDKFCWIFGGHHLFRIVEPELYRISRPMATVFSMPTAKSDRRGVLRKILSKIP